MLKNVYAPLSGGIGQERVLEILSNNIANASTTGFKEDQVSFSAMAAEPWSNYPNPFPPAQFKQNMKDIMPLHGNEMSYVAVSEVQTSFEQGPLRKTGNNTDLAVSGKAFFSVQTPFGERFTRDGGFGLTPEGMLVTKNGFVVQGENGPLTGLTDGEMKILPSGEVYNGEKFIDKLKTVEFNDPKLLQRLGSNLWVHDGPPENIATSTSRIEQGYIENSNVNPMKNMTNLIIAHRTYEALQKAVKAHDESMHLSATKVGEAS